MDDISRYANCSLSELEDISHHIDREKYADRYAIVLAEIEKRQQQLPLVPLKHPRPISLASVIVGAFKGAVWGAIIGLASSIAFICFLAMLERAEHGDVDWDHAIGLFVIPMLAVALGVILGSVIGSIRACKRD